MNTDRRSVCMLAYTHYDNDARVRREAETLTRRGFRVTCLTPGNGVPERLRYVNGVRVHQLRAYKYTGRNLLRYTLSYLRFLAVSSVVVTRMWLRRQIDLIHVHNMPDFLVFAATLPRAAGKKLILDVHDSMPETFSTKFSAPTGLVFRLLALQERASSALAHRVICVNHPQRDTLVARGVPADKILISMNSPDDQIFQPQAPALRRPDGRFRLVYHGTMARRLGVDLVIRTIRLLAEELPELELHLWGAGEDLEFFQQTAAELELEGRVFFNRRGHAIKDLPRQLAAMDVGVVGNRQSVATDLMLPVKLLEYVAVGLPAIAPRLKTIQHYFSEDQVAFFEPGKPEAIAEQILRLHRDPQARLEQARLAQSFLHQYGWHNQGPEFVGLYSSLSSEGVQAQ